MSATQAADREDLDLRAVIADIDRKRAETQNFAAEQRKLTAEATKFNRDPWMLIAGAIIAGAFTRLPEILHALGIGR